MREYTGGCERHLGAHPSLLVTHRTSLRHTTLPFQQHSSVVHDALNTLHYAHCSLWSIHYAECAVPECQALVTVPEKVGNRQSEGEVHASTVMISAFFCICIYVFVYLYLCICVFVFVYLCICISESGVGACARCSSAVISHDDHLILADHLVESIFSIAVNG